MAFGKVFPYSGCRAVKPVYTREEWVLSNMVKNHNFSKNALFSQFSTFFACCVHTFSVQSQFFCKLVKSHFTESFFCIFRLSRTQTREFTSFAYSFYIAGFPTGQPYFASKYFPSVGFRASCMFFFHAQNWREWLCTLAGQRKLQDRLMH